MLDGYGLVLVGKWRMEYVLSANRNTPIHHITNHLSGSKRPTKRGIHRFDLAEIYSHDAAIPNIFITHISNGLSKTGFPAALEPVPPALGKLENSDQTQQFDQMLQQFHADQNGLQIEPGSEGQLASDLEHFLQVG